MGPLDIAICGCGPAGLASALFLAEAGHRVHLVDQFDTPKPLGSGLLMQPTGLAILDRLGLGDRMRRLGHRIDRLYGRAVPSQRIVLDVRYAALGGGRHGFAVHRGALFNVLFDAVQTRRIAIETGFRVARAESAAQGRTMVIGDAGRRLGPFDLVIDALGSRSTIAHALFGDAVRRPLAYGALWATVPWTGAPFAAHHLEQRYSRASIMIGALPVGRRREDADEEMTFFWSLKPTDHERWRAGGLPAWKDRVRAIWPETDAVLAHIVEPEQLVLAAYGHHTLYTPHQDGIAFVGDTAHATSPQLGQGANMALLDAWALARSIERSASLGDALSLYARARRRHVRLYQALSAVFTPFYQSDSMVLAVLRDQLFAPATRLPGVPRLLANLVAGTLGDPLERIGRVTGSPFDQPAIADVRRPG